MPENQVSKHFSNHLHAQNFTFVQLKPYIYSQIKVNSFIKKNTGKKMNPKMLAIAREARGLSQVQLSELCGVSRSNISRYEIDLLNMSENFLIRIKQALGFPDSFYLENFEALPAPLYRKRDKVPAKYMAKVEALINIYKMNIEKLLKAVHFPTSKLPSLPVSKTGSACVAAMYLTAFWKLNPGPIENLTEVLEAQKIITVPVDFGTDRVDSRSIFIADKYPVIFYNKNLLGDRLRFTLAYELGHLIMHSRSSNLNLESAPHESNLFAAEFLMPETSIKSDFEEPLNIYRLAELKRKWKTSMHALLYRAEDTGMITENQKRYMINEFNAHRIRRREPKEYDVAVERGKLLRDLITNYRTKQKLSLSKMAAFFNLYEAEFLKMYN